MRRWPALILLAASGCSNAPLAGFLDLVRPSHVGRAEGAEDPLRNAFPPPPSGGVQIQPPASPPITLPGAVDSGFTPPPLSPRDSSPTPPPERRPSRDLPPFTLPNT